MKTLGVKTLSAIFLGILAWAFLVSPSVANAQWRATVGGESSEMGKQALAFLPNEIWIHVGDSITWTFRSDLIHTLTFLTPGQLFPSFQVGCPGFSAGTASFDGSRRDYAAAG
jgi:plastocyanin